MTTQPLILVADDETHIVNVIAVKLQSAGYEVVCARNGEEAIRVTLDRTPDLVITDYQMPVMNGHELCKRLLAQGRTSNTPVILLTGQSHSISDDVIRTSNIRAVIGKPFSPRDVLSKVDEILNNSSGEGIAKAS